jgi:hypothetical protein
MQATKNHSTALIKAKNSRAPKISEKRVQKTRHPSVEVRQRPYGAIVRQIRLRFCGEVLRDSRTKFARILVRRKLFHYCDDRTVEHHRPAGFGMEFVNIDTGFLQELPPQIGLDRAGVQKDIARFRRPRRTIPRPSRSRGSLDWRTGLILEG